MIDSVLSIFNIKFASVRPVHSFRLINQTTTSLTFIHFQKTPPIHSPLNSKADYLKVCRKSFKPSILMPSEHLMMNQELAGKRKVRQASSE